MHNPPQFLYIEITPECNLRCKQCHHWMLKESDNSLKTEDKLNLIRQFHKIPHSRSKCNKSRSDFKWCFVAQAFSGPVVND